MILVEQKIETALRTAIRASLATYGESTPALQSARIVTYWLGAEDATAGNDASGIMVMLNAKPSSSAGWIAGVGLEPIRSVSVDVYCVTPPDSDGDRSIMLALYQAVRSVFETHGAITMPAGVTFGGLLITNGGAAEIDDVGQVTSFTVEMKVTI